MSQRKLGRGTNRPSLPQRSVEISSESSDENLFTAYRWGWYFFSLMMPFAGIFIALLLFDQDSREVRRVGRNCLFVGFFIWVLFPVMVLMGLLFVGAMTAFSFVSDMMPTD